MALLYPNAFILIGEIPLIHNDKYGDIWKLLNLSLWRSYMNNAHFKSTAEDCQSCVWKFSEITEHNFSKTYFTCMAMNAYKIMVSWNWLVSVTTGGKEKKSIGHFDLVGVLIIFELYFELYRIFNGKPSAQVNSTSNWIRKKSDITWNSMKQLIKFNYIIILRKMYLMKVQT